jgi:hypothetical protein
MDLAHGTSPDKLTGQTEVLLILWGLKRRQNGLVQTLLVEMMHQEGMVKGTVQPCLDELLLQVPPEVYRDFAQS